MQPDDQKKAKREAEEPESLLETPVIDLGSDDVEFRSDTDIATNTADTDPDLKSDGDTGTAQLASDSASTPTVGPTPAAIPTVRPQAYVLPIQPLKHDRRKGTLVLIGVFSFVVILALVGGSSYMILSNSKANVIGKSSSVTDDNEIVKIPAITNAIAAPEGWKSFKSKKFGVSFTVPKEWSVNENDPAKYGSISTGIYGDTISVFNPEHNSGSFEVRITREKISDYIDDFKGSLTEDVGYRHTTKEIKWQGYSATELKVVDRNSRQSDGFTMLLVQISDYVFSIPNLDTASVDADMDEYDEYKQFIASIRIDNKVVEAQAKIDAKPIALRQGKDIDYGKVVVPAGWQKGTSSKYGISFVMRSGWEVNEQTNLNSGAVLSLTIGSSESFSDQVNVLVTTQGLDEFMNQSTFITGVFGGGKIKAVKEKMKWHGYDARRVILRSDLQEMSILFVRVGNYTYSLPDPSSVWKSTAKSDGYSKEDYQILVKSIRISK